MLVRKSEKSKMKKEEYMPVSSDSDKSETGSDGEGGKTKENELEDQCNPFLSLGHPTENPKQSLLPLDLRPPPDQLVNRYALAALTIIIKLTTEKRMKEIAIAHVSPL